MEASGSWRHSRQHARQAGQGEEAEAAECAVELGGDQAFWQYVDKIFERTTSNGKGFALDQLVPLAQEIGLNKVKFRTCLDSGKYKRRVQEDFADGLRAGVTGTPGTFVYNNQTGQSVLVSGAVSYNIIKQVVERLLN